MANTTLTQTGAQVQSILDKADKLPATVGTNGQVLTSDGTNLAWQTPQGGDGGGHKLTFNSYAGGTIIYADGTTELALNIPSGTIRNNVIAILGNYFTIVSGYGATNLSFSDGSNTYHSIVLFTDVVISQSGGGAN